MWWCKIYKKSNRPWKPILTVSGFLQKNQALSFEYRVKKKIVKTN